MVDYRRVRSVAGFIIGIFIRMTFYLSIFGEKITRFDNIKKKWLDLGLLYFKIGHRYIYEIN